MITIKNKQQIEKLRTGGRILAEILHTVVKKVKHGIGTQELDALAEKLIKKNNGRSSFKGYSNGGPKFPTTSCICLNNEIVHAPAIPNRIIKKGDIVSIDIGMEYEGMFTDTAHTIAVGKVNPVIKKLIKTTKKSLGLAIKEARSNNLLSNVGAAVQRCAEAAGFNVVRDLVGHGVGFDVHEEPQIPNYLDPKQKPIILKQGMVLAIEPMIVVGDWLINTLDDGWTAVTADGLMAAHFEHTVVVTESGGEVVTKV